MFRSTSHSRAGNDTRAKSPSKGRVTAGPSRASRARTARTSRSTASTSIITPLKPRRLTEQPRSVQLQGGLTPELTWREQAAHNVHRRKHDEERAVERSG